LTEVAEQGGTIVTAAWPTVDASLRDPSVEAAMTKLQGVIRAIRDIRAKVNDVRSQEKKASVRTLPGATITTDQATTDLIAEHGEFVKLLATCDALGVGSDRDRPSGSAIQVIDATTEVYVPLGDLIDLGMEKDRLGGEIAKLEKQIKGIEGKLTNENFTSRAPAEVVQRERDRLTEFLARRESMRDNLDSLG
jgi:valyl-tRNA synthetase